QALAALFAQLARRPPIGLLKGIVGAAQTAESRRERDLRHRQVALIDQPLGKMQPARLRNGERRGAHVLEEQAIEMPRADTDTGGELADAGLIERPFLD